MKTRAKGFTLIEMAVVLVVIGLLLAVSLPFFTEKISQEKLIKGRGNISALKREIIGYALANRSLPEWQAVAGDNATQVEEMANAEDAWGNPIAYWANGAIVGADFCDVNTVDLDVIEQTPSDTDTYDDIAFVIASAGANFNLQVGDSAAGTGPTDTAARQITVYSLDMPFDPPGDFDDTLHTGTFTGDYDVSPAREEPFDDIVEYVSFAYLRERVCSLEDELTPTNSAINFDNIGEDFGKSGANGAENYRSNVETAIVVDETNGEIRLGNDSDDTRGCIWYNGVNATPALNCTKNANNVTVCSPPSWTKLRQVFKFSFLHPDTLPDSEEYMGGFVYAIINGDDPENNTLAPCGGGGGNDGYLGYANSGATRIYPPKFGIEVDVYPNGSNSGALGEDNQVDPYSADANPFGPGFNDTLNHVAAVYWSGDTLPEPNDNQHGETATPGLLTGAGNIDNPFFQPDIPTVTDDGFMTNATIYGEQTLNWLEDAQEHWIRIELERSTVAEVGGANDQMFRYTFYIYIDDTPNANFLDVGNDYTDAQIGAVYAESKDVYLNPEEHAEMDSFRFGWTMAVNTDGDSDFNPSPQSSAISSFGFNIAP